MVINGRILTSLFMFLVFASMTAMALTFPPKAQLMPLMVGAFASGLSLAQLLIDMRAALRERREEDRGDIEGAEKLNWTSELNMFFWLFAFLAGILSFGFLYAAPVLVFAFLLIGKRESFLVALFGALGTWATLFIVFDLILGLYLFEGFLTPKLAPVVEGWLKSARQVSTLSGVLS